MQAKYILFFILPFVSLSGHEQFVKNVYAHLAIQDSCSACEEAQLGLQQFPEAKPLHEAYIKALAKAGNEKGMLRAWKEYTARFPEEKANRDLIENMAWGIIENGYGSDSPMIRVFTALAAFFAQDAKGVDIIYRYLNDTNSHIRAAAVKMAGHLRDAKLKDAILRLSKEETVFKVRLEVIQALGSMKITESRPHLESIIADEKASIEEKAAAIQSLVTLLDDAKRQEVEKLARSSRAGLRLLACEVVIFLDQKENIDLIIPLINDTRAEVRAAALETLAALRIKEVQGKRVAEWVAPNLKDPESGVAIAAARVIMLADPLEGQKALEPWLKSTSRDVRLLASAALASCGKYGLPLMTKAFNEAQDTYVKMNLAIGLIGQRVNTQAACQALYKALNAQKEKWMWEEKGIYKYIAPSDVEHNDLISNYPEAVNQQVRLEVLNILAMMKYPDAQEGLKRFLQERSWGISGMASIVLLSEGDETAVDIVKKLLKDPNQKIRIQAALILAMWDSGDEEAIALLQSSYDKADREMKDRILEGIGQIGSPASIPFLIEKLGESSQTMRLIAASALLQCLYH